MWRNPLEAGQKFNEVVDGVVLTKVIVAIPLKRGKSSTVSTMLLRTRMLVAIPLKRGKSSTQVVLIL